MKQIAPNTFVSTDHVGANVGFFVMPRGVVAIDAPVFPRDARAWRDTILEAAGVPILYLVLTDAHPDRMLSAALLGAPIVAAKGAYEQSLAYTDSYWRAVAERWVRRFPEAAADASASRVSLPEIVFSDRLILLKGGAGFVVEEVPGAAPGSAWVYLAEHDVLFAGDTVVAGTHPWISSAPDTRAWLETLSNLRRPRYGETQIVPGRGPVCASSATEAVSEYLALMRRRIRSMLRSERARGDVVALVPEFLDCFPVPDGEREPTQRRIRADLERVYDELLERDE